MHSTCLLSARQALRRRRWLLGLALACLISVVLLAGAPRTLRAADGQKWALVVGVDHYDSDTIAPLKCAGADARALAQALVEVAGFPKNHVVLMTSDAVGRERPTRINVLKGLAGFAQVVAPGDEFVFFFSGHGVDQDNESFLLTGDCDPSSTALLQESSLSVKRVQQAIREVKASRILQLVDACRNDPRSGRGAGDNKLTEQFSRDLILATRSGGTQADAAVTLFSCRVGQRSYEGYNGHGYFTYFLVEGLRGAAATDGRVTLPGLVTYLEGKVSETVRLRENGKAQVSWADTSGTGAMSWVLATPGRTGGAAPYVAPPVSGPSPVRRPGPVPEPRPSATSRPVEAKPPKVTVTAPLPGAHTSREAVVLGATITGGGDIAEVTVTVNGQDVPLGSGAVKKSAQSAVLNVAVPLEVGENTIMVTAMSTAGQPAQTAVTVERKAPSAPVPSATRASEPVAETPAAASPSARPAAVAGPKRPTKPQRRKPARSASQTVAVAPPAPRPHEVRPPTGNEMVNAKDGSVLVAIPGGTFTMGSNEYGRDEKPPHSVALTPYWIGKYAVTNAQFSRFVQATGHRAAGDWERYAREWGEDCPVVNVSWHDAVAYCNWADLRLPTEAEWEFAARGSDGRTYPWGNEWDASRCRNSVGGSPGKPVPVGSYPSGASPFGCMDMAGNVWQWCSSKYKPYPYNATDGREELGGSDNRVLRGGSWYSFSVYYFRGAYRLNYGPGDCDDDVGFRLARTR